MISRNGKLKFEINVECGGLYVKALKGFEEN